MKEYKMDILLDLSHTSIHTDRLTIRFWKKEDLNDFYAYASEYDASFLGGWTKHTSIEESVEVLKSFIINKNGLAIVFNDHVIGSISITECDKDIFPEYDDVICKEIGFALSKSYWNNGFMTEALKELLQFLFIEKQIEMVICICEQDNKKSKNVLEKCGFIETKSFSYVNHRKEKNVYLSNVLTKENWEKNR